MKGYETIVKTSKIKSPRNISQAFYILRNFVMNMQTIYATKESHFELVAGSKNKPRMGKNDVLIKVIAASLNPHDWKFYQALKPLYKSGLPLPPMMLGHDLAGKILATGSAVKGFAIGDAVYAMSMKTGAFAEIASVNYKMLAKKPASLSFQEAAATPMAALTALQAFKLNKVKSGEKILVIGGSGGVGCFAIQIAKAWGCEVSAVCSTRNVALVKSLGADQVFDYQQDDYLKRQGLNFDVIFDTIGNESTTSCKNILKPTGRFISTRTSGKFFGEIISSRLKTNTPKASTLLAMPVGRHLREIAELVEQGKLKVVLDKTFKIKDINDAIAYSKTGRTVGKIVLDVENGF
jgi:NADPH:quinone reductase-like Zn-dependent oxidoreductase